MQWFGKTEQEEVWSVISHYCEHSRVRSTNTEGTRLPNLYGADVVNALEIRQLQLD